MTAPANSIVLDITHPLIALGDTSGGTCKRMIGSVKAENAGSGATADHVQFAVGIVLVTSAALAAGSIPLPLTILRQDWYYWKAQGYHLTNSTNAAVDIMTPIAEIDIHTMCRCREGWRLVLIVEKDVTTEVAWNIQVGLWTLWTLQA